MSPSFAFVVYIFRLRRMLICSAFTTACLPPHHCLISSPLPTTSAEMVQIGFFFFFFLGIISLLGSFVKLCYKQRHKIEFLRKTSRQFGKFVQLPTVILKRAALFCNGASCCFHDLYFSFTNENTAFRKRNFLKIYQMHIL